MTATESVISQYRAGRMPKRLRGVQDWAESEIVLTTGPRRDLRYRSETLPWSRLLFAELGKWRVHVITGPVQSGKSLHAFVMVILYYLFEVQEDVIVGLPDIELAKKKWEADIKPAILSSSYVDQIPDSGPGSKGGKPTQIRFKNGRSLMFMGGGGGDEQRSASTARVLCITETDKIDEVSESSKEGQNKLDQLFARTEAYDSEARIFCECTLSTDDAYTWRTYTTTSTASRIVCQCVHCDAWVTPEREHFVGWQDAENAIAAGELAAFSCPECGGLYKEEQRREMNQKCKLIHKGQEIGTDGAITGDPDPTDTLGFRWNAFNNLLVSQKMLGQKEWSAANRDEETREEAQIAIKQQSHCLPAKNENVEKTDLSVGMIRGTARGFAGRLCGLRRGEIPHATDCLTAFVDVSKRHLQWEVVAWLPNQRSHTVDYGFFETISPDMRGEDLAVADALRGLRDELHKSYQFEVALVDSGWKNDLVYDFVRETGGAWWPSMGEPNYRHPRVNANGLPPDGKTPSENGDPWHLSWQADQRISVLNFDPDAWKHRVHAAFRIPPMDSGNIQPKSITLFGDDANEHVEYGKQICAEKFVREFVKGKGFREYWHKERRNNHMLDCRVGNYVARSFALSRRSWNSAQQETVSLPAMTTPDGRPFLATGR